MWDLREADMKHKKIEIFQIWVNLPSSSKQNHPSLSLLKNEDIPVVVCGDGVDIKVICGTLVNNNDDNNSNNDSDNSSHGKNDLPADSSNTNNKLIIGPGSAISQSPMSILHISMKKKNSILNLQCDIESTMTVYVRQGSLIMDDGREVRCGDVIVFRTASSSPTSSLLPKEDQLSGSYINAESISNTYQDQDQYAGQNNMVLRAGERGLDALILAGKPLREPVIWQGKR